MNIPENHQSRQLNKRLLAHAREARAVTEIHRATEKSRTAMNLAPSRFFSDDLRQYIHEFAEFFPDIEEHIEHIAKTREARGERTLIVDVAGVLHAAPLNADTIGVTLTDPHLPAKEGRQILTADLISHRGLKQLENAVDAEKIPIAFVFFNPHAGASLYAHNPFAYRRMSRIFALLYQRLAPKGEIYGSVRFDLGKVSWKEIAENPQPTIEHIRKEAAPGRIFSAFRITKPE